MTPSPKLLVPIHLAAFVVNNNTPWGKNLALKYDKLANFESYAGLGKFLEESIELSNPQALYKNGVHLHWTLPAAFRKGAHNGERSLDFPLIPNRWLVIRMDDKKHIQAWIIESDSENPDTDAPKNWVKQEAGTDKLSLHTLGKAIPLSDWQEKSEIKPFLTAMAPGSPEFAAVYTHSQNMLGFYDALAGITDASLFTYQVYGWFSEAEADPFFGAKDTATLSQKLAKWDWSLADIDKIAPENLPQSILCHAMIHSVEWRAEKGFQVSNNLPSISDIELGIGNSASEAIAAMLSKKIAGDSLAMPNKLLAAFQYKSLNEKGLQYDSQKALQKQLHDRAFYPISGGTHWVIEPKEKDMSKDTNQIEVLPFDTHISDLLNQINLMQVNYDGLTEELIAAKSELYAAKYSLQLLGTEDGSEAVGKIMTETQIIACADALSTQIENSKKNIATIFSELLQLKAPTNEAKKENLSFLARYTGTIPDTYQKIQLALQAKDSKLTEYVIKEVKNPPFYQAKDPTIVINGLAPAQRYTEKNTLNCRTSSQLVTNIRVIDSERAYDIDNREEAFTGLIPLELQQPSPKVPKEIANLFLEGLLFSPLMKRSIAQICLIYSGEDDNASNSLQKGILAIMAKFESKDFTGTLPDSFSVSSWTQPWIPIYMEWGVKWTGNAGGNQEIFGRTLLSSDLTNKVATLNTTLNVPLFQSLRPMAQELSGFGHQLIGRYKGIQLPILTEELVPDADNQTIDKQYTWQPMPNKLSFFPLRNGYFEVSTLRIVDAFGQMLEIINKGQATTFEKSKGLETIVLNKKTFFSLPTRIMQPASLRLDWISASHADTRVSNSDPGTSPVCGWFLLNKIDKTILVFDTNGKEIGEIAKTSSGIEMLRSPINPTITLQNTRLKGITDALIGNEAAFTELYGQIDASNQKVSAKASRQSLVMGLPMGFPLAVVAAQCTLTLKSPSVKHLFWDEKQAQKGWQDTNFSMSLGDANSKLDGLVGYCMNGEYKSLTLPFNAPKQIGTASKYLAYKEKISLQIAKPCELTLLLDPRMSLHLNMDILPSASYDLAQHYIQNALAAIQLRFLVAPILTPITSIKIPLMKSKKVAWTWIAKKGNAIETLEPDENDKGMLTFEAIHAVEGWLVMNKE